MAQLKIRLIMTVTFVLGAAQGFAQTGGAPAGAADEARTLQRAVQENPGDPMLHYRLSQAYAVLDRPRDAFDAAERALALSPDSVEFLRARATLATWLGDYDPARETYGRLCVLVPGDADLLLSLARVSAWIQRLVGFRPKVHLDEILEQVVEFWCAPGIGTPEVISRRLHDSRDRRRATPEPVHQ
jgi:tetratricopeptide (TPR) repeat protein